MRGPKDEHAITTLRAAGMRVTAQRRAVLAATDALDHATADGLLEAVRAEMPEVARATVYKALSDLEQAGLVRRVEGMGAARFEVADEPAHPHLVCAACGRVVDLPPVAADAVQVPPGARIDRLRIVAEGRCAECARRGR